MVDSAGNSKAESASKKPQKVTPMLEQYQRIKSQYPDAILFYRMGDFYEMFFEDALEAAPLLEVQLTARDKNAENPIPMCGIPHHAAQNYIQKLLAHGKKIAICEQLESPSAAKGVVKRDVIRVVTPALVGDPEMVSEENRHLLVALQETSDKGLEACLLDLFSGELLCGETQDLRRLEDTLLQYDPKEFLIAPELLTNSWFLRIRKHFNGSAFTERGEYFEKHGAHGAVLRYIEETQKVKSLDYLKAPAPLFSTLGMALDSTTISTLEIFKTGKGSWEGPTLFNTVNFTQTPMGRRLLKEWLATPLLDKASVEARFDVVGAFISDAAKSASLTAELRYVRDLERLTSKAALNLAQPRDLVAIREILKRIPAIKRTLHSFPSKLARAIHDKLDPLESLTEKLEKALLDEAPLSFRDGGIFRDTYSDEIAELRSLAHDAKSTIAAMEMREKDATSIPSLKIKFNKVFGYTIEVTKTHLGRVPKHYIRKQTISTGERYVTEELKEFEQKVLSAETKLQAIEEALFLELRKDTASLASALLENAHQLATLDVLLSFATAAKVHDWIRPTLKKDWDLNIEEGRHPVVETLLEKGKFVPNSVQFDDSARTLILTGPNMSGKSTIMRQVALISLMAQAGSFVPAKSAALPLVDAIYTRIGSSDDLAGGRSTFMVEMTEMARILRQATQNSLILVDEIGRGTSTYDGLSLAWSLIEFMHNQVRAKTLFATHFHEVTSLEQHAPGIKNMNVLVEKWEGEIVFLHKLAPGICNRSYGIEVAALASLPQPVLVRAREILGHLESQSQRNTRNRSDALQMHQNQMTFFE
ncbi:MAG: DNA mismatch repair protein MutS [Bdellovibrionaceae bacterium]|nr:DNA mismatch repair protein MutS [Bdellovibrionales bacterium]MCB9253108.1 DNA mismatch repair protein MutS [Pseudobdellovibrionaceae bacterium]